jgi:hypothetical protein
MAQNSRATGELTSVEAPDEREGWEQNARDLEAIANHLEEQKPAKGPTFVVSNGSTELHVEDGQPISIVHRPRG